MVALASSHRPAGKSSGQTQERARERREGPEVASPSWREGWLQMSVGCWEFSSRGSRGQGRFRGCQWHREMPILGGVSTHPGPGQMGS